MPNIDENARTWELELAARVGTAVYNRRKGKWTAVELAERTRKLDYPISRIAITKIEGNTRAGKLGIAELVVLAEALEVSPLELLFPDAPNRTVNRLPNQPAPTREAMQRFVGDEPLWPQAEAAALINQLTNISASFPGRGELRGDAKEKK